MLKHYWIFSLWPQKNRKTGPCWRKCIWKQFTENWFLPGLAFHKGLVHYPWKKCTQSGNNVFNVILQKAGSTCTDIKTLPMHSMLSMQSMQSLSVFTILQQINTRLYSLIDGPSISFALQSFQIYPRLDTGQSKHCNAMIIAHFKF